MSPGLRKLIFASHVTLSVGWLGAVLAYLAIVIAGPSAHVALPIVAWYVIVPLALSALLSGLVQSLATEWGLVRHYWVIAKLALTLVGTAILLMHAPRIRELPEKSLLVHAAGGLAILLAATMLSVFKPWGKTAHGRGDEGARKRYAFIAGGIVLALVVIFHVVGGPPKH